jgi:hypothetical protein
VIPQFKTLHACTASQLAEIEQWKERFLAGAETAPRSRPLDEEEMKDREIKRLKQKLGPCA